MATDLTMPRLSDEMTEGTVSRWLKQVGDPVSKGEAILEVETEKVIVEIEATADGIILEIVAAEQEVVPVDGLLCRIGEAGEGSGPQPKKMSEKPVVTAGAAPFPAPSPPPVRDPAVASAVAPASNVVPMVQPADSEAGAVSFAATPLARRIAQELGIDLSSVRGSGIGGKIVKTDLQPQLAAVAANIPATNISAADIPVAVGAEPHRVSDTAAPGSEAAGTVSAGGEYEDVPHTPLRRTVARRMSESKREIPHFYMTAEADVTELLRLRRELNAQSGGRRISVNDVMIKAVAQALERVPEHNAAYLETGLRRYRDVHIGFAVAIAGGLLTPVVRDCHAKSLGRIALETADLIDRAKTRKLLPRDLEGGTFTISNMGMYDVVEFSAILNPPQVGILAIARPVEKPVVEDGRVVVRSRMRVTLSSDHRAVEGAQAAEFLKEFKAVVENPVRLML